MMLFIFCALALFSNVENSILPDISKGLGLDEPQNCIFDAECRTGQFCKTKLLLPIGKCEIGKSEDEFCVKNSVCASNDCSFFKCTKRIFLKDGPCVKSVIRKFNVYFVLWQREVQVRLVRFFFFILFIL